MLLRDGLAISLGPRAVAVLAVLVQQAGEYVPKSRILDSAWPGVIVEEGNLRVQIAAIRHALAQAGGEDWIERLPRRGYRFAGPVVELRDAPPARSNDRRSNLPVPLTSFVGRERELVEIKRLLASRRLLTIVGAGGIGKTRVALQAAAEVLDAYRDGVWIAELGSVRDPALVTTTVAHAVGVQERPGASPMESLCGHLKARQVLLILDNCEHLPGTCAELADRLLGGSEQATILATSREPLRATGEQIYALSPLSLPETGSSLEALRRSEAVALFVERVQLQLSDFELTAERAPAVVEICVHLDGIPLALELAAARAQSLSVEQIGVRLSDRFRLLTSGARAALPRQQTLRATLDWSYGLLNEQERVVLRRLAVFPATFTIEAAAAIASDERIDDYAVIDLLSQLVSRSLVIADTAIHETRYRLLETTRAYALEKLVETNENENLLQRHALFFRKMFEPAFDDWLELSDPEWRARYLGEIGNLRAALDWALEQPVDREIGIELASASGIVWSTLGLFSEGVRRLQMAITRVERGTPDRVRAPLWLWLSRCLAETPKEAGASLERAIELYRRLGEPIGLGIALVRLARCLAIMGKFEESEASVAEAWPLLKDSSTRAIYYYHFNCGFVKSRMGDMPAAREEFDQALALARELRDDLGVLAMTGNVVNVMMGLGDLDGAIAALRNLVGLIRSSPSGTPRLLGTALMNLAGFLLEKNDFDASLAVAREGLPLLAADGSAMFFSDYGAHRAGRLGNFGKAALLLGYADRVHAENDAKRSAYTIPIRERFVAKLHHMLAPDELARLLAEGAKLSEEEACRLALEQ